ncbi:MAG: GTP-binding protein, partial [Methylococcales bacterium]|nr:GTP-binding protein [Methylococcales bacterium]
NLTYLNLRNTQLSDLSVLKALPKLILLDLVCNQLSDISVLKALPSLTQLDLRFNQLTVLPEWLLDFKCEIKWQFDAKDHSIFVSDNPFEEPPPEIIQQGNKAIKAYFDSGERSAINEVKLILVGNGGAGKTSLSKVLRGLPFDEHEKQTHGINIDQQIRQGITVNYWDFGGQEMMHATHQFFLSKRSLYILVLDGRKEENEDYWLKFIESFGGNAPILVVLNKMDEHHSYEVNSKHLKRKYKGIQSFHKISCEKNTGLDELNHAINEALYAKIPLIQTKLPNKWLEIKTQLVQLAIKKNFIGFSEFRDLCQQQGVDNEVTHNVLAQYFNDLGVIIHFDADYRLCDTPVLNPHWITQAVYKIIGDPSAAKAHGVFYLNTLHTVLAQKTKDDFYYPKEKQYHIISLMENFNICYAIDKTCILIPDLLKKEEPDFEFDYNNKEAVRFRIQYDFFSKLLMPSFIVKLHKKIEQALRWRTGVVLKDSEFSTRALIKADEHARSIKITVIGEQKRDFFTSIRNAFKEIHQGFAEETFKVTEWVLLPDEPNYEGIKYQELIGYEKAGEDRYLVGELGKYYRVSELLNGIEKPEVRDKKGNQYNTFHNTKEVHMASNKRTIKAKVYIKGNVSGGKVAGGDIMINYETPKTKDDFLKLFQDFKEALAQSGLPEDEKDAIRNSLQTINKQLQQEKPKASLITRGIEGINGILADSSHLMGHDNAVFTNAVQIGQLLFGAVGCVT